MQDDCGYCNMNLPNLTDFQDVHFLPDPVVDKATGEFMPFSQAYSTKTGDSARPSLQGKLVTTENDRKHKNTLISGRPTSTSKFVKNGILRNSSPGLIF
jgi:hypothetical protein